MLPVMQVLGAGARGCRREFRTPAIHPGAAARRAGSGAWLFLVVVGPTCPISSSYGGYHLLQQGVGVGVSFQGLS